ncbi:Fic family protein [uncultured Ellagibacter sp.]|uniref:Fic family protein n=1 Tax=uncultured Ellagibacter sp. TaxID=2137580 RepID=UPI00262381F5|nr:Fic family protein [uncultured Ellagibacter sp.]
MTADSLDNFEYKKASEHVSESSRRHYWAVAIGLQDVDGLTVSRYLREAAASYTKGERTLAETGELVRAHHANSLDEASAEADLVSQRIAELLERGLFSLAPEILPEIHRYLFQDLDSSVYRPGQFKTERMVKQEEILNGDSVLYADPAAYDMSLRGAFASEVAKAYTTFSGDELKSFCHFVAFLWQIHPFAEGNTRTVAVFSELYLNYLGFNVANEPFGNHARFFRDALVRAMYRNVAAGITPDDSFLVAFYENALGFAENKLSREELICTSLFENPDLLRNVDPKEALRR